MIRCFPDLFPDELFYSACARFSDKVKYSSNKILYEELFGNRNIRAVVDLPCRLGAFVKKLPDGHPHPYTTDILINNHTLFPIYAPFLPRDRANSIYEVMAAESGHLIHRKLGTVNSQLSMSPYIRYCPSCVKEDIIKFGECYWHRSHQVRGFEICPQHLTFIENSSIRIRTSLASAGYFSAERSVANVTPRMAELTDRTNVILIGIAKEIMYLLDHSDISLTPQQFIMQYNNLLAYHNFLTKKGLVRHIDLISAFTIYYTPELLDALNCSIYIKQAYNSWLARVVSSLRGNHPFLHHLLAINFLGATIEDFFAQKIGSPAPFGNGPWPCLNPVCPYYEQKCIQTCEIRRMYGKDGQSFGVFSCTCGFVYGRKGPDHAQSDIYHKDQIISYGEIWEIRLKELWLDPTITRRQIAQTLRISEEGVTKRAVKLHLPTPRKSPMSGGGRSSLNRDLIWRRKTWLNLLKDAPEASLTELWRKAPSLYRWLHHNDHEWFVAHRPLSKVFARSSIKRDYSFPGLKKDTLTDGKYNDSDLAENVRAIAHQLLEAPGRPKRVSLRAISTHLPQIIWLRSDRPHIIPLTIEALNEVIETREQYAIRRIWFVAQQYQREKLYPSRRDFAIRASVRNLLYIPLIMQNFEEALSEICKTNKS
ncbi:MAG TPA: TnsD family Tn7-like transposition protein [Ktedonobacteraceae bacterium]|nr:TnsD family Tn7-like transposition protein [Ktedonobacteraceae bacterium]